MTGISFKLSVVIKGRILDAKEKLYLSSILSYHSYSWAVMKVPALLRLDLICRESQIKN